MTVNILDDIEEILERGSELMGYYINNPVLAAYDLLNVDLAPIQRIILRDMWFKNFVITVASRGLGKSQSVDSLSYFNGSGLVYLKEMLPSIPKYLRDGEDEVIKLDEEVYTSKGFKLAKRVSLEKNIAGKKIITRQGFINKGSNQHRLLSLNKYGEFIYKRLDEFTLGDRVCLQRGHKIFGSYEMPSDDAYLIGLFIGDGSISDDYNHQSITTIDDSIKSFCIDYCIKHNVSYRIDKDEGSSNTYKIIFKQFDYFFDKYKIDKVRSYYKSVPYKIRTGTEKVQKAFLQGYFDSDGTVEEASGGVSCCSVSKKLLNEVQLMLLNFGIVSHLRKKKTNSNFDKAYLLDMFSESVFIFSEEIGFRLDRKQKLVNKVLSDRIFNTNIDTVPLVKSLCKFIDDDYRRLNGTSKYDNYLPSLQFNYGSDSAKEVTYNRLFKFIINIQKALDNGYKLSNLSHTYLNNLYNIAEHYYFFDTIVAIEDWIGDCYDFEMDMVEDEEPNYFSNGFINHNTFLLGVNAVLHALLYPGYRVGLVSSSFRQSKMIFSEIEKLYQRSSILREACEKRPVRGADTCNLRFKGTDKSNGSFIEALPIGVDGAKIRGSRFYLIEIDELAQVPPQIIDMVLRPMAAVTLEPMQRVREHERQLRMINEGLIDKSSLQGNTANKMIMTSSGYFKFNHMWDRMKSYWRAIEEGEGSKYAVHQVPYQVLPKGFLDEENIKEAKRTMSRIEFQIEYEAKMVSDSDGFFKASLLEAATSKSAFTIEVAGDNKFEYVMGIDPNQGGNASCGIVIIKLTVPAKIVYVVELKKKTLQEMVMEVQRLTEAFNLKRIFMDSQGGGKSMRDLLREGYNNKPPIIELEDVITDDNSALRILQLVNPTPSWISDANFDTLSLFENRSLLFPSLPMSANALEEKLYEEIHVLKSQLLSIVVTQTSRGAAHFDTPKKGQNKDLYSALVLACWGIKELSRTLDSAAAELFSTGYIRPHRTGSSFSTVTNVNSKEGVVDGPSYLSAAVLKSKIRRN